MTTPYDTLDAWIDAHFDEEVRFLQELVRVPTPTPPGHNAPHAQRTAELLRGFGRFWIEFAMQEGYRELFLISGPDLRTFLGNLDNLHARLGMTFVGMDAPSFAVTDQGPDELLVHYYSSRAGLTPFVQGLLEGLGPVFGQRVEATVQATRADGRDHDTFHVRCTPSPERAKGVALPVN